MRTPASETIDTLSAPLGVFLNLTQRCNMRCVYCCAEAVRARPGKNGELTDTEMLALVEQLVAAKVFRFVLTGGEVLLRRDLLFRMLERLTACAGVSVLTNGSLITDEDARRLAAFAPVLDVAVSIDAPEEEINALTRGRGFLARTLEGARRLMEHGITPTVNCVVSRANQDIFASLVDFLKSQGFRQLLIIHLLPVGHARDVEGLALSCAERLSFSRGIVELAAREKDLRIGTAEDEVWLGLDDALASRDKEGGEQPPPTLLPCSAGIEQCDITADGWVTPCNAMQSYRCGNVRSQDFLSIWRDSPQLAALRALRRMPVSAIAECARCRYNTVCQGGCRAIGFAHDGDLLGFDVSCPYQGNAGVTERSGPLPVL
jgi:radical SAM protein with 4Fe4S-binding SPASM domain